MSEKEETVIIEWDSWDNLDKLAGVIIERLG